MSQIGPAPLGLTMPAELAAVDLAGLRLRAAQHLEDAAATASQAAELRRAVVRLVPAAWLGLGALGFAGEAMLQASTLEAVSGACHELGSGLRQLAADLDAARHQAADAVRIGTQVDEEVAAVNAARLRRPPPERVDPAQAWLDATTGAARTSALRLAVAVDAAQQAWRRAAATFDLVAYAMPGLAARMNTSDDGWRPAGALAALPVRDWRALVGPAPVCVGAGWAGAGALAGPDGRRYPLVVPWVERDGRRTSVDPAGAPGAVATLDGTDPGWHPIGVRVGIDTFGTPASTADKAAVITAGLLGAAPRTVGRLRPDLLRSLVVAPDGTATLGGAAPIPAPRAGGTGQLPRSALVPGEQGTLRYVPDTSADAGDNRSSRRATVAAPPLGRHAPVGPNVVALTGSGLAGVGTAARMDDTRTAAYRVTFEENDDGRRRARLTTYQVVEQGSGPRVVATDVALTPEGGLVRTPLVP